MKPKRFILKYIIITFCLIISFNIKAENKDSILLGYKYCFLDSIIHDYYLNANTYIDSIKKNNKIIPTDSSLKYNYSISMILFEKDTLLNIDKLIVININKFPKLIPDIYYVKNNHGCLIYYDSNNTSRKDSIWKETYIKTFRQSITLFSSEDGITEDAPVFEYYVSNYKVIQKRTAFNSINILWNSFKKTHQPIIIRFDDD